MAVDRFLVTFERDMADAVRAAAADAGLSAADWLAQAAADRVRNQLLGAALDAWEAEDGPITEAEMAKARALLEGTDGSSPL